MTSPPETRRVKSEAGPAIFSVSGLHRYTLTRTWDEDRAMVAWVGLNPSTADERQLDPTLRRVLGFSQDWGYGSFVMLNLFGYRATKPSEMREAAEAGIDIVGPGNDQNIIQVVQRARLVICAWGTHGALYGRDAMVVSLIHQHHRHRPFCLGYTAQDFPRHPLYVKADTSPQPFDVEVVRSRRAV